MNSYSERYGTSSRGKRAEESPVSPVTGIVFPSPIDASTQRTATAALARKSRRDISATDRSLSNRHTSSDPQSDLSESASPPPADSQSLDQLWDTLRQEKQRKMAKEQPKVKSFEDVELPSVRDLALESPPPSVSGPSASVPMLQRLKKHKSMYVFLLRGPRPRAEHALFVASTSFRDSPDGRIIAIFDMRGVDKQDIHISFQRNRLVVTWETYEATEWEEDGCIVRERLERMFHRTLPLPDGTRVRRYFSFRRNG